MEGWIKMHRKMIDWQWFTDVNTCHLFFYCIMRANHEDSKWQGIDIKRGQFITSLPTLAKETGLSVMQVRTSLKKLNLTGELTDKVTNKYRVISITNYSQYQEDNRQTNRQITDKQQADNRQVTADKNEKKEKNTTTSLQGAQARDENSLSESTQLIQIFDESIVTVFGEGLARGWANATDATYAERFVEYGAKPEFFKTLCLERMGQMKQNDRSPPSCLKFFEKAVIETLKQISKIGGSHHGNASTRNGSAPRHTDFGGQDYSAGTEGFGGRDTTY